MCNQSIVRFNNGELEIDVTVSASEETVWLNRKQISMLFDRDVKTIGKHINNIFREDELRKEAVVANFATTALDGKLYDVEYYNLDVIISVGYRVKSKQGITFRKWANNILKEFMLKGYVIDVKKFKIPSIKNITQLLEVARKTSGLLQLTGDDMLDFLLAYNKGLKILDDYDHQTMESNTGNESTYILNYDECIDVINRTTYTDKGDLFGLEKNDSFKSAIATIYQSFGGVDFYPTLEDKAANLLYLITKNHAYADGNKRIAATIFLYFLERNQVLFKEGKQLISNTTLATLTILVASSNPNDKESIVNLIKLLIS